MLTLALFLFNANAGDGSEPTQWPARATNSEKTCRTNGKATGTDSRTANSGRSFVFVKQDAKNEPNGAKKCVQIIRVQVESTYNSTERRKAENEALRKNHWKRENGEKSEMVGRIASAALAKPIN